MRIATHLLWPLFTFLASTCSWGQGLIQPNFTSAYNETYKAQSEAQRTQADTELKQRQAELLKTQNSLAAMKLQALRNEQGEQDQIAARPMPTTESDQRSECGFIGTELSRQSALLQQISLLANDSVQSMLWQDAIQKTMAVLRTRFTQVRCDALVNADPTGQSTAVLRDTPVPSSTSPAMATDDENDWDHACGAARSFCRDGTYMCDVYRREFRQTGRICHGVSDSPAH
jgi:hypothetical protein